MALGIAPDQVLLADAATGRELVRLTTLQPVTPTPLAFSPDGTKLAAATAQKTVLVWDLRRIRDQLAPLGLDWDAPPYPASTATAAGADAGSIPPPRLVRVVGEVLEPQARRKAERAEMDRRLAANPDDAEALIHRGWLSLTERRLPEAIADLDRLHRLQPDYPDVERMLGQAYQDAGNLAGALAFSSRVLERAPEDHDTRFQRGLLALALGLTQQAADDFDRVLAADPTRDPGPLPPRAGVEPAGPVPRGPGRSRRPDRQKPEGLRCCTSSAARPTRPSASTSRRGSTGRRHTRCCPRDPNAAEQSGLELGDRLPRAARPRASPGPGPASRRAGTRSVAVSEHPRRGAVPRGSVRRSGRCPGAEPRSGPRRDRRLRPVLPGDGSS